MSVIKICLNETCSAVWHEIPIKVTRCPDCGSITVRITRAWYDKRYRSWPIQLRYDTREHLWKAPPSGEAQFGIFDQA